MLKDSDPLWMYAEAEFGRNRCPCCGVRMRAGRLAAYQRQPRDFRTRGHDYPVGRGGDVSVFVYMCHGCNGDQGSSGLVTWARNLIHSGDRRAEAVTALAVFVRSWVEQRRKAA